MNMAVKHKCPARDNQEGLDLANNNLETSMRALYLSFFREMPASVIVKFWRLAKEAYNTICKDGHPHIYTAPAPASAPARGLVFSE